MRRKYQWEEWFGRPHTVLLRGIHYHCSQSAMCQSIRNNASQRSVPVRLIDTGTEIIIEVRGANTRGELSVGSYPSSPPDGLEGGTLPQGAHG